MSCKELKKAIETMKTASLTTKKELATALEDTGAVSRSECPVKLPLEDGSQIYIDLQYRLFDPEDEKDGSCHISIASPGVSWDEVSINRDSFGYEICPKPELVVKAVENKLRGKLRALQEWDRRVTEITRLLSR
jgi:hypothetical protein